MLMITNTNAGTKLANGGASIVVNADGSETLAPVGLLTLGKIYYAAQNGLAAALAAAGSNGHVVVADAQAVTTALTVPAGVTLEIKKGGLLTFSGSGSLTFAARSTLKDSLYQMFAGATVAGTVVGSAGCCEFARPEWWGAAGVSAATDTPAIQAAIDFCTGTQTPATHTRVALCGLGFLARTYLVGADLNILSTQGFRLRGAGWNLTQFKATGTGFTQAVFNIDGAMGDTFEGFSIVGDGTEACGVNPLANGILLQWSAASNRSTSQSQFRGVNIYQLAFVNGIFLAGHNQVDGVGIYDTLVAGSWTAGNVATWQNGILLGDGTSGNNMDHNMYNSSITGCANGVNCNRSSINWWGGEPATNGIDVVLNTPAAACAIQGLRSEGSGQAVSATTGSTTILVSIADYLYSGLSMQANGKWLELRGAGPYYLKDVAAKFTGAIPPIIACEGNGVKESVVAVNVTQEATPTAGLTVNAGGTIVATGYTQVDNSNVVVARWATWRNNMGAQVSPPAVGATTVAVANPYPYTCSVYVSGGTVTAIAVAGVTTGLTSGLIRVPVGQSITITYSVAPSWQWVGD